MDRATTPAQVQRRLAPLKVTIGLLYQTLAASKDDRTVSIDRMLFDSVVSTLELVVDDLDGSLGGGASAGGQGEAKKAGEAQRVGAASRQS